MPMIGGRIREIRLNQGWTLDQVSTETGLSVSFLSMLERDKVSVSVDNLDKLAHFLGVRMVQFFQGMEEDKVVVTRASQIAARSADLQPDQTVFLLLTNRNNARMEPLHVTIAAGHGDPKFRVGGRGRVQRSHGGGSSGPHGWQEAFRSGSGGWRISGRATGVVFCGG